jgi:RNA polymerase sigma factor (sigma-70 family)
MVGDINPPHAAGDMVSIEEMVEGSFRDHAAAIRGKALQLTRDPEMAADVTQEAFLRLYVEARAGRMPDNVSAWLYRTSANLIISGARHAAVAHRLAPRLVNDDEPTQPEAIVVLRESHDELDAALARLPAPDRAALVLAAHGATGRELAHYLGRSPIAARTVLCRARRRLRTATILPVMAPAL